MLSSTPQGRDIAGNPANEAGTIHTIKYYKLKNSNDAVEDTSEEIIRGSKQVPD